MEQTVELSSVVIVENGNPSGSEGRYYHPYFRVKLTTGLRKIQ